MAKDGNKGKNKDRDGESRSNFKSGNRRENTRETQISRKLSFLLRHGAEKAGNVTLHRGGWVLVSQVLAWGEIRRLNATFEEIINVTATNDKKRYQIAPRKLVLKDGEHAAETADQPPITELVELDEEALDDADKHVIRATQGHSIKSVEASDLLIPIVLDDVPDKVPATAVHGTDEKAWLIILKSGGLKPMSRTHVHLASSVPGGAEPVISGMRKTASILIWVDVKKALEDGMKWWRSANGVILSDGTDGMVSVKYFEKVERRDKSGTTETIWTTNQPTAGEVSSVV